MLLANISVAKKIFKHFPKIALLRRHPAPKQKVLREVIEKCNRLGIPISGSSSKELACSLSKYSKDPKFKDIHSVLVNFLLRTMSLARYCSAASVTDANFSHYALNVDW